MTAHSKNPHEKTKPKRLGKGLGSLIGLSPVRVETRTDNVQASMSGPITTNAVGSDTTDGPKKYGKSGSGSLGIDGEFAAEAIKKSPADSGIESGDAESGPLGRGSGFEAAAARAEGLRMLPLNAIEPSPFQPRRVIDEASVEQLASSIRRSGVMQPVIVRPLGPGRYELVVGERRWRASRVAQLAAIPALVRDLPDEAAAEWALVENVQREDLNAMERAYALRGLCQRFGMTQTQVAERVSLDRSTVANLIRLTELEPSIAALIEQGRLGMGHGRALLSASAGQVREALAMQAATQAWSVRKLERECQRLSTAKAPAARSSPRAAVLADLEKQLADQLGTKVWIRADRKGLRGRVVIEFYGHDHFEGLLVRMGVRTAD